jgi:hypothetical protein
MMHVYTLLIKADSRQEALEHLYTHTSLQEDAVLETRIWCHAKEEHVIVRSDDPWLIICLQNWFNQDIGVEPPFPQGSLLYWCEWSAEQVCRDFAEISG